MADSSDFDFMSVLEGLKTDSTKQQSKDARKLQQQTDDAAMARLQAQLQAQQALQTQQQQADAPYKEADLTGLYNGQQTLAAKSQALDAQIKQGTLDLQKSQAAFDQAMADKNYDLANRIQTEQTRLQGVQVQLQQEKQTNDIAVQKAQLSGYMADGSLTEAAKEAQAQAALQKGASLGYYQDPITGQITQTDASKQWQAQAGLSYAQAQAALKAHPADYFQSDALMTGANASGVPDMLRQFDPNSGIFRGAINQLPANGSIQNLYAQGQPIAQPYGQQVPPQGPFVTQMPPNVDPYAVPDMMTAAQAQGPSASVAANMNAAAGTGAGTYSTQMNQPILSNSTGQATNGPVPAMVQQQATDVNNPSGGTGYTPAQGNGFSDQANAILKQYQPIFQAGAQKLAPGSMESLNPTQLGLFQSAAGASGVDPDAFQFQYKHSRLSNDSAVGQV